MSGKAGKTRQRLARLKKKRERKTAMKALYEARIAAGTNSRRSRIRSSKRKRMVRVRRIHPCGNIGCPTCKPELNG